MSNKIPIYVACTITDRLEYDLTRKIIYEEIRIDGGLATAGCSFAIDIPATFVYPSALVENAFTPRAFVFSRIDRSQFQLSKLRSHGRWETRYEPLAAKRCGYETITVWLSRRCFCGVEH